MKYKFAKKQRSKSFGFWRMTTILCAMIMPMNLRAQMDSFHRVIYTETPVDSYFAFPNDPNFIPVDMFMQRAESPNWDNNIEAARMAESAANPNARIAFADRPTVVCRDFGCTRMNDRITRTFLFNSLANMFMMNQHSRIFICEADPFTRGCLTSGISFPAQVGIANAMAKIPHATVDQVSISTGMSRATIGVTFEFLLNGVAARCSPTTMDIVVPQNSQATLVAREFSCTMTQDGNTNVSMMFNIDYIDLDYGILGGYYSLGLQGPALGGGTGYVLFKTEFSNSGRAQPMPVNNGNGTSNGARNNGNGQRTIQPGEYAVEPLQR
ncbi:MAG: hypothetical protein FWE52_00585 [Alphaproteobacteria bacterium]|nr:hypothetical protein [Alphaproteobacteria bacterium]